MAQTPIATHFQRMQYPIIKSIIGFECTVICNREENFRLIEYMNYITHECGDYIY